MADPPLPPTDGWSDLVPPTDVGPKPTTNPAKTVPPQPPAEQDTAPQPTAGTPPPRPSIPGYEILGVLGRGGMGVVYRAVQEKLKRIVALKMIRAGGAAGPDDLDRFRREAEAVARLQHANVVQIYEVGEHDGCPYFSLEYVAGGSLAQRLDGTPMPARPAAELVETLARALHAAHTHHIVHRDLKPGNVLLTEDGTPKITDFGLAKRLDDEESGPTLSGAVVGTPSYMAPEQARGRPGDVGPAADVYALGAILYELLTGRPPFRGATLLDTLEQVCGQEPVPPRRLSPKVPWDLQTICLKCLEKTPGRRYATALELADDLRRCAAGDPIRARPVGPVERGRKWARRRPALAAALAATVLVAAVGFALVTWKWQAEVVAHGDAEAARQAEGEALRAQQTLTGQLEAALAQGNRSNLYLHLMSLAQQAYGFNRVDKVRELLDECPPDLRGWEWRLMRRQATSGRGLVRVPSGTGNAIAYSPDGKRIVTGSGNEMAASVPGEVCVWDAATGQQSWPAVGKANSGPVETVGFSPDGRLVASASTRYDLAQVFEGKDSGPKGEVVVWDTATGRVVRVLEGVGWKLAFSPDGGRLAAPGHDMKVRIWNSADWGAPPTELPAMPGTKVSALAFAPDGRRLAVASRQVRKGKQDVIEFDITLALWNVNTRERERILEGHRATINSVAFSPAGDRLVSAGTDKTIKVWRVSDGKLLETLSDHISWVTDVVFAPDGRLVASSSADQSVRIWDANEWTPRFTLRGHGTPVNGLAFDPTARGDAWRLLTFGKNGLVKSWTTENTGAPREFRGHEAIVTHAVLSPDGSRLASCDTDHTVRVWDVRTGRGLRTIKCNAYHLAFSPDGARLACGGGASVLVPGEVRVYDVATGKLLHDLTGQCGPGAVKNVAFDRTGTRLATASAYMDFAGLSRTLRITPDVAKGEITVWDLSGPAPVATFREPGFTCVAFYPDGRQVALARLDAVIDLWDLTRHQKVRSFAGHDDLIESLAVSPDGSYVAAGSAAGKLLVWDASTGQEVLKGQTGQLIVANLVFAPAGDRLVSASWSLDDITGDVKVWHLKARREVFALPGMTTVSFSGDGQLLATTGVGPSACKVLYVYDASPLP